MSIDRSKQFYFKSDLFAIDPKEDEETNPFLYGKSLAEWLRLQFSELGYTPEPVIPEDWGWCVMLQREPFQLWIGCTNLRQELLETISPDQKNVLVPDAGQLTWCSLICHAIPIWTGFYWKKLFGLCSPDGLIERAEHQLEKLLSEQPGIKLVCVGQ